MKQIFFYLLVLKAAILIGQLPGQWEPLPNVKGAKAIINKREAVIDTIVSKEKSSKIQEIYNPAKLEFISIVKPDTLEKLEYKAYELNWTKRESITNGLIFKDIARHNIKYLDKPHGLPNKAITSIAEDKNGLIYLTSYSGLLVFNGTEITIYEDHPYFSFSNSKSLFYDKNGKMWIATDEQVGYIYDGKLFLPEKQIFGGVHLQPFREDKNGDFIISTNFNGLFIIKDDFILHYEKGLPHSMIADAILTSDDKLWIAFVRHGVGFIKNDSLFAFKEFGTYNNSRSFLEHNGELWIGNFAAPLLKYRNDSLFTVRLNTTTNYVYSLEKNLKGIWFSDYGKGVFLIKPDGQYHRFYSENGLSDRNAYNLFIDSYENVWVADLLNGLSRIDENLFYKNPDNSFIEKISETEIDLDGNSWHFRNGELLTKETPNEFIVYRNIPDTSFLLHAHCIDGFIRDDGVWMGSYDMGIIQLNGMEYTYHELDNTSYNDNSMFDLEYDDAGGIWTVTDSNLLLYLHNDQFYNFSDSEEWKDHVFVSMKKTRDGEIFVTTRRNGLIQIENGRYQKVALLESPNSKQVSHVFKDSSDEFWFFMNNEIQLMKEDGSFSQKRDPIFNNNPITDFIEIEKDNFLGVSSNGIISIKKTPESFEIKLFDRNYGLYMVDNVSIHQNSNGEVIIANTDGIVVCDSTFINKKSPPKLSFNRIIVDDSTEVSSESHLRFDQQSSLKFIFNNIFWGGTSKLFYQLNRGNRESNWNQAISNSIPFNDLTYGDYQLTVYAEGDGVRSEQLQFDFEIKPYWYQTSFARWGFIILIACSTIGFFYYRENRARVEQKKLKELVDQRTEELRIEKNEVTQQLAEKEILMQEVHHRVKNNLTFLKSLLYLRSKASDDDRVKIILDECQSRVQSMALVHQNLYDVEEATMINFQEFLKELFSDISSMFDKHNVELRIEAECMLSMQLSIFLGLIINELLTNTFKYAYGDILDGELSIAFTEKHSCYILNYDDNGKGFPPDFDIFSSNGFGFKLIRILLDQIDAKMSLHGDPATSFKIEIPK